MVTVALLPVICLLPFEPLPYTNKLVHSVDIKTLSTKSLSTADNSQLSVTENCSIVPVGMVIGGNDSIKIQKCFTH